MYKLSLLVAIIVGIDASAASSYTLTQLPKPVGGIQLATGFNSDGQVLFYNTNNYIWDAGQLTLLPHNAGTSYQVTCLNDSGTAVGYYTWPGTSNARAAVWIDGVDGALNLGNMTSTQTSAYAISNDGWISGTTMINHQSRIFMVTADGQVQDVASMPLSPGWIQGMNIDHQIIIAWSACTGSQFWDGSTWHILPALDDTAYGNASGINDAGQVVGYSAPQQLNPTAVIWNDCVPTMLSLPVNTTNSGAKDINNNGEIVGWYSTGSTGGPCYWDSSGLFHDLGGMIDGNVPAGFKYTRAKFINDAGQIVCTDEINGTALYLLTPVPEPASLTFLALGSAILLGRMRR